MDELRAGKTAFLAVGAVAVQQLLHRAHLIHKGAFSHYLNCYERSQKAHNI